MQKSSRAFVNEIVVCLIVAIGLGGSAGLGVVWMRHQISTTSNHIRVLKAEMAEVDRLIEAKSAAIASVQRSDHLRKLNDELKLNLVPMSDVPVFNESMERARRDLIVRNSREVMEQPAAISVKFAQH